MKTTTIKNNWLNDSDLRVDASFHLSDGVKTKRIIEKLCPYPTTILKDEANELFKGNIHKRVYASSPEHGYMFFTASDLFKSELDSGKYVSKKHSPYLKELELKKDWILITRSGTLGNVLYTTSDLEGKIGTDDLVRIKPKEKDVIRGYLYAYLASRYGYGLLTQSGYGGVVKHIEPHHIADLPIPILPQPKQQEIHNLIVEAADLRVEANKLLREAVALFDSLIINYKYGATNTRRISIRIISKGYKRFDSLNAIVSKLVEDSLKLNDYEFVTIGSQSSAIFIGPRSKSNYVSKGIPFLSTSAMQKANPTKTDKYINAKSSEGFIVEEGWILTTRSGTLGDTIYTLPALTGFAISEDAIRIVLSKNAVITNEYLYAFLKSSIGKNALLSGSYGSVVQHLNEDYIGSIKVPLLDPNSINSIEAKTTIHLKYLNDAIFKENQAIDLVEKEIESWQK